MVHRKLAFLGVDPGKTGSIAAIDKDGNIIGISQYNANGYINFLKNLKRKCALTVYIERVHAMPRQGVVSTFNFGLNYGMIHGIFISLDIPFTTIEPTAWKKYARLLKMPKEASWAKASTVYPQLNHMNIKKMWQSGIGDALIIANYCRSVEYLQKKNKDVS